MTWVWHNSLEKGSNRLVLLAIADNTDDDGDNAYPSVNTLANKCQLSERNTRYILRQLEQSGAIVIDYKGGRKGANVYRVVMKMGQRLPLQNSADEDFEGQPSAQEGQYSAEMGQPIAPNPSSDPSLEPSIVIAMSSRPRSTKPDSPELASALALWRDVGLGPVSMNATTKIRKLIAAHGVAFVLEGIQRSADQAIAHPVSWMESAIPAWKRERSRVTNGRNGTNTADIQRLRGGQGVLTAAIKAAAERDKRTG